MPLYEYKCPSDHVTERVISLQKTPPKWIKCDYHRGSGVPGRTHYEGCGGPKGGHTCGLRAKKVQVYRVGVTGDLPTRGAF